jgi:hypothetical protein
MTSMRLLRACLSQVGGRPERWVESRRFPTTPSVSWAQGQLQRDARVNVNVNVNVDVDG